MVWSTILHVLGCATLGLYMTTATLNLLVTLATLLHGLCCTLHTATLGLVLILGILLYWLGCTTLRFLAMDTLGLLVILDTPLWLGSATLRVSVTFHTLAVPIWLMLAIATLSLCLGITAHCV